MHACIGVGLHAIRRGVPAAQAAMVGMRRQMAVSVRACGICGGELGDFGAHIGNGTVVHAGDVAAGVSRSAGAWGREKTVQLACKHVFHDLCIRGWAIVGKKVECSAPFNLSVLPSRPLPLHRKYAGQG
jgi:hypothetical protein